MTRMKAALRSCELNYRALQFFDHYDAGYSAAFSQKIKRLDFWGIGTGDIPAGYVEPDSETFCPSD